MNKIEIYEKPKQFAKVFLLIFSIIALLFFYIIFTEGNGGYYLMFFIGLAGMNSAIQYEKLRKVYFTYNE